MKKIILSFFVLIALTAKSQVGIGTSSPASTSALDLTSTTKGFLVPRMTASEKSAIGTPATGLLLYQTDGTAGFYYYTGSAWINLTSSNVAVTTLEGLSDAKVGGSNFTGSLLIGHQTTGSLNNANENTGIGMGALSAITSGGSNTASGYYALNANTSGGNNTANGNYVLYTNTTGGNNSANGISSLYSNTTGYQNTASGSHALYSNTTGARNTASGTNALYSNVTGDYATAIGYGAMLYSNNTTTPFYNYNVAMGYNALRGSTTAAANTGNYNTACGSFVLNNNTTGNSNTATGFYVLISNTTGNNNTASGSYALNNNSIGYSNTAIGNYSGANITTGSNLTCIGYSSDASANNATNEITLGNSSVGTLRCQVTSITALSDKRDKADIKNISEGLDFVKKLKPVTYTWNTRDKAKVGVKAAGFIAQDLLELQNNSKIGENLDLVSTNNPEKLEARYGNLLPVLVKAIQEQQTTIEQLMHELSQTKREQQILLDKQTTEIEKIKAQLSQLSK